MKMFLSLIPLEIIESHTKPTLVCMNRPSKKLCITICLLSVMESGEQSITRVGVGGRGHDPPVKLQL